MVRPAALPANPTAPPPDGRRPWHLALALLAALLASLLAYWGVWGFGFVFDDNAAIVGNRALQNGDWWAAAFGSVHTPLANRPFACLSLALDLRLFGAGPLGPHVTNLILHLVNVALVFTLLRAIWRTASLAMAPGRAAALTLLITTLWGTHALGCDAVAYATQRSTLLGGACLLVSLLATVRGNGAPPRRAWQAVAIVAMAFGMASKEDLVVGPLLVLLFDRACLASSWRAVWTRRGFHLAMAATWLVLVACVVAGPANATVGYGTTGHVTAWQWLMTQAGVVVHYLRLCVWPVGLRGAYDWDIVRDLGPAILPGCLVMALLGLALWSWRRRPGWAWLGAWFFLLLAPTSTVLPIVTEVVAERRCYLPLLAVVVLVVIAGEHGLRRLLPTGPLRWWIGAALGTVLTGLSIFATRQHVVVYQDEGHFWQAAYAQRDPDSRSNLAAQILSNQGLMLFQRGQFEAAYPLFDLAMQCDRPTPVERTHYAVSLQQRGRHAEAIAELERVVQEVPNGAEGLAALGTCLATAYEADPAHGGGDEPRLVRAEALLRQAVALAPGLAALNTLGYVLKLRGQWPAAEVVLRQATELSSERVEPFFNRAEVLERLGRAAEIGPMFERLSAARPRDVELRLRLVNFDLRQNQPLAAIARLQEVLRIDPNHAQAAAALRQLQEQLRR